MSATQRRLAEAGVGQARARLDLLEARLDRMEAVAASVEDLIMRIERLERWLGPRSFATAALREQRRELIAQARARGLSIQGIARAFGLSPRTVESVVKQLPEPEFVRGLDGRRYAPRRNGARPQP